MISNSEENARVAAALVKAGNQVGAVIKDARNPHFKSAYASLEGTLAVARPALAANGLALIQSPGRINTETGAVTIVTRLVHESGEWYQTECEVPLAKRDPQGMGSAITYGRRYSLLALLSIPAVDDDAEAAMFRGEPEKPATPSRDPDVWDEAERLAEGHEDRIKWLASIPDEAQGPQGGREVGAGCVSQSNPATTRFRYR
jgi:hypothetical protein